MSRPQSSQTLLHRKKEQDGISLRTKLVLSYLFVTLGAIIVLAIAVIFAVQATFASGQQSLLRSAAQREQGQAEHYLRSGNQPVEGFFDYHLLIIETAHQQLYSSGPANLNIAQADSEKAQQALTRALQGKTTEGHLDGGEEHTFSGYFISTPLYDDSLANRPIIGAMFYAQPEKYLSGFSPQDVLLNVNQAILLTGLLVSVAVIIFSLLLAQNFTRPIENLTEAAEEVKEGNYARRVVPPNNHDELSRLAQTFNEMANRIESDVNELKQQEQIRRDLIANIAHDLATPLTAIQGFSEALADDMIQQPEQRQETAQLIGREVQRMRRLVGDMQQTTALESGRVQLEMAPLDLHALVDETLAVIEPECEQAGIILRNEILPDPPSVRADSDRITQVLLNLLDNARRYTPSGGTITVGARPVGQQLEIWVSDTGRGIGQEDLSHIFERFYRADRSRTGKTGGSGLGLSIVKAIIAAHGGQIGASSTLGQGTRVTFTLPLASPPSTSQTSRLTSSAAANH